MEIPSFFSGSRRWTPRFQIDVGEPRVGHGKGGTPKWKSGLKTDGKELTGMSCWYLGSMDEITPIKVGWIRPVNRWNHPTYELVTITSMDTLVEHWYCLGCGPDNVLSSLLVGLLQRYLTWRYLVYSVSRTIKGLMGCTWSRSTLVISPPGFHPDGRYRCGRVKFSEQIMVKVFKGPWFGEYWKESLETSWIRRYIIQIYTV